MYASSKSSVTGLLLGLLLAAPLISAATPAEPTPVAVVDYKGEQLPVFVKGVIPKKTVGPKYPQGDHGSRVPGHAVIAAVVDAEGKVIDTMVVDSKPSADFGAEGQKAVKQWRFPKIMQNGKPVRCIVQCPLQWDLASEPPASATTRSKPASEMGR